MLAKSSFPFSGELINELTKSKSVDIALKQYTIKKRPIFPENLAYD